MQHDHPIFGAKAWGEVDLGCLPDDLLRWFSADVAERVLEIERNGVTESMRKALDTVRRSGKGELQKPFKALNPFRNMDSYNYKLAKYLFHVYPVAAADNMCRILTHAVARVGARREGSRAENRRRAELQERKWLLRRLRYLCEVWRDCGARAPHLLYDGTCPIPWEEEEACDGVEA